MGWPSHRSVLFGAWGTKTRVDEGFVAGHRRATKESKGGRADDHGARHGAPAKRVRWVAVQEASTSATIW